MSSIYDIEVESTVHSTYKLDKYKDHVIVIVNTATKCGLSGQFDGLEKLYQQYKDQKFIILGFPCNQFANQEPGSAEEAAESCKINYGVTFPIHEKINVNGENEHPLYTHLKEQQGGLLGSKIKWNFTKFVIDRNGEVVKRFSPKDEPEKMDNLIQELLEQ
ncbi:glutathione peroxidase homolog BsaA [Jeotgalicoccus coquinae]|uniref:Glutathione peroxidase n=1 Tax=Jeotgalicoccus coquinae TaxID=709509 RepID=A0A6V7R1X6_9STAP|nr:glutathione peroxidase [Jeotgalicoccus coquinae]MBB6423601.1 glutathione peroxidase [Jeotgalicoccus coquinae]GGE21145.1 glutathione peroxidase homolog BsaA [Jeotgalicoccus coquinae]CAD2071339.1 Glutathione peroxidase BsaA [Jeotgalicoccus coquinae]